jgi:bifunctional DNase/RNase
MAMKEITITGFHRCSKGERPVLVMETGPETELHLILTSEEAHRIASEWQNSIGSSACPCSRKSIYSLVQWLCIRTGIAPSSIVLDASEDDLVVASVRARAGTLEVFAPCQPADALALAIRLRLPVFATETLLQILERRAIDTESGPLPGDAEAAPWLRSVTPEQFAGRRLRDETIRRGGPCDA